MFFSFFHRYFTLQTVIIGASEGLYSFDVEKDGTLKPRSRIEGLAAIHQILVLQEAGVVLFIAGILFYSLMY